MTHDLWIIIAIAGFVLLRYPARLAFNRRNQFGAEQFGSYDQMRWRRWLERAMHLVGLFIIITGLQHGFAAGRHAPSHRVEMARSNN